MQERRQWDQEGDESPANVREEQREAPVPAVEQGSGGQLEDEDGQSLDQDQCGRQKWRPRQLQDDKRDDDIADGITQVRHALCKQEDGEATVVAEKGRHVALGK